MNTLLALPEMIMAGGAMALLLIGAWRGEKSAMVLTLLAALVMVVAAGFVAHSDASGLAFHDMFAVDGMRRFIKLMILVAAALSLLAAPAYLKRMQSWRAEYPALVLLATLGMMLMVSAHDLIALYMGLELQNLALYVLTGFRREDPRGSEAAVKYFALGALSSCVLLFGLSLLYGFAGSTGFAALATALTQVDPPHAGMAVGLIFVVAGLAFKVSAVPFHMWTPDVYEGAPTSVTAFLATAPKVAALSLLAVVLAQPLAALSFLWQPALMALAVASMLWGALGGLMQGQVKRLMAYSTIVNVGTLLLGLVVVGQGDVALRAAGLQSFLIYLAVYFIGTLGVFSVLLGLSHHEKPIERVDELAGLAKTHPFWALAMAGALFSLAGVPPLAGFLGKYFLLFAVVKADFLFLALLGVLASVVAAGYYLRVVKIMYFDLPHDSLCAVAPGRSLPAVVGVTAVLVVVFIVLPAPLIEAARQAAESLIRP